MSGNCECKHALRQNFDTRTRVVCAPVVTHFARAQSKTAAAAAVAAPRITAYVTCAIAAGGVTTPAADNTKPLLCGPIPCATVFQARFQQKRSLELSIAVRSKLQLKAGANLLMTLAFLGRTQRPRATLSAIRNVFSSLSFSAAGSDVLPSFQYRVKLRKNETQKNTLLSESRLAAIAIRAIGAKLKIEIESSVSCGMGYKRQLETEIKCRCKLKPKLGTLFNVGTSLNSSFGVSQGTPQAMRARPVMRSAISTVLPKLRADYAIELCLACVATVHAPLIGPGGNLTVITAKKKARVIALPHPDNKKFLPGGAPFPKKYVWRLVTTPEDLPACACEFIHIGFYDIRNGKWGFNQERPVALMVPDTELVFRKIFRPPEPVLFPQMNENGEHRVVMVKNLMYDINPPATFVRLEALGDGVVDRRVINTELVRMVFVYEGCGGSFFLINADCDG